MSVLPIAEGPVAAVVAHPDDETFGLGALLANLANEGREVRVLCFTHGEASTIGVTEGLGEIRRQELLGAAQILGVTHVTLLDFPDGRLDAVPDAELDAHIDSWLTKDVAALVVLEPQGVTGHPDHRAASRAAERVADRRVLPVIEWGVDPRAAARLHDEHGLSFQSIDDGPGVHDVPLTAPRSSRRSSTTHRSSTTIPSSARCWPCKVIESTSAFAGLGTPIGVDGRAAFQAEPSSLVRGGARLDLDPIRARV